MLKSLEIFRTFERDPTGETAGGRDGIEAGKANLFNGRPVAALSRPLIHRLFFAILRFMVGALTILRIRSSQR